MKILFVFTEINVKFGSYGYQDGIAILSAYLKSFGHRNIRLCYVSPRFCRHAFQRALSNFNPDIIAFYTTHDQFRFIQKLIEEIKNLDIFTICGGPHVTLNPETIYEIPRLNAVCIGEGERPLLELLQALKSKKRPLHIKNLWIRQDGEIIRNDTRPFIEDINELPFADRELFSQSKMWNRIGLTQISYKNSFRVSRGCPYQCSFCSNKQISSTQDGRFVRFRSVDGVLTEIESVSKKYHPYEIYFQDDTFTINQDFLDEFCNEYQRRIGLPFEFFAHISPSTVSTLEKLRKIGGRRVSLGIESGNQQLRRKILKKNFSNNDVIKIFKESKKMGYKVEAFVMGGLPDETPESFNDTVQLIRKIQPDLYSLSIYFPFKGTDLYDYSVKKGYIASDFKIPNKFISRRDTLLRMPDFSRREILNSVRAFGWKVYKDYSLKKGLLFILYESGMGNTFLKCAALFKRLLRKFAIGKS